MYYVKKLFLVTVFIGLLTGCGMSAEEEIFNHLENAVSLESVYEEQQQPLVELEKKEQEIYKKIISLGMSELDEVRALSKEALAVVDERATTIEKEKESIDASKQEFQLIEPKVDKIDDEGLKKNAEELVQLMNERYVAYSDLYQNYTEGIALDRQLYEMFQKEDLTLQQLDEQVKKINEVYDNVENKIAEYNDLTDTYNQKKKEFYIAADLNVVFESNEPEIEEQEEPVEQEEQDEQDDSDANLTK